MDNSFYSPDELAGLGLKSYGENVLISRFARLYSPGTIDIGNHVRIDDFCILSGMIKLGSHIHISAYCGLYGKFGIVMEDYSCLLYTSDAADELRCVDLGGRRIIKTKIIRSRATSPLLTSTLTHD